MTVSAAVPAEVDVAIIGAGIGGLAAAVALRRLGIHADVFEQADELREVGGAILIRRPSLELFEQWGLGSRFHGAAVPVTSIEMSDAAGDPMGSMPAAFEPDEPEIVHSVHRADVHDLLRGAVQPERLHLGRRLEAVTDRGSYAEACFADGSTVRARVLIGADGIRSVVRAALDGGPLVYRELVTNRTIAPATALHPSLPNDRMRMWRCGERVVLLLPIRSGSEVAVDAVTFQRDAPRLWSTVDRAAVVAAYADFDPRVLAVMRAGGAGYTTHPVYDREPLTSWSQGRIVLLGDAAHPMAPMQGQGANQAIQDAGVLARHLAAADTADPAPAIRRYQEDRIASVTRIQLLSRQVPVD